MIRPACPDDVPAILHLVTELADYERARHEVEATEEQLQAALFSADARVHAHVAEHEGEVVGFALWFVNFSTWVGRHGIYLEDLYVDPRWRGFGYGKALLTELAGICVERGYGRLDWAALDWNKPARDFYEGLGAAALDTWVPYRMTGDALKRLAGGPAS